MWLKCRDARCTWSIILTFSWPVYNCRSDSVIENLLALLEVNIPFADIQPETETVCEQTLNILMLPSRVILHKKRKGQLVLVPFVCVMWSPYTADNTFAAVSKFAFSVGVNDPLQNQADSLLALLVPGTSRLYRLSPVSASSSSMSTSSSSISTSSKLGPLHSLVASDDTESLVWTSDLVDDIFIQLIAQTGLHGVEREEAQFQECTLLAKKC